jgi:hypothetical protein
LLAAGFPTGTQTEPGGDPRASGFVPPTPQELAGKFPQLEILELIGRGGMGAVYRARQKALDRVTALKILPPGLADDPAFAQRFAREAKALARMSHPNIVTLYEFGEAGGLFYFLMEFVDGVNLRQLLEAGRVAPREALAIVPQICEALQYAHDLGIVHRDIKPENILLDRRGRVKVADFGLARLMGLDPDTGLAREKSNVSTSETLTEAGKVMGTPQYMAPEQMDRPAEVDHRADIYALGVVFYQMLTGELPGKRIEAPSRKVLIDVRLDEIVMRALEKKPERRYQQASVFKTEVEMVAETPPPAGGPTTARQIPPVLPDAGQALELPAVSATARLSGEAIAGVIWIPFFFASAAFLVFEPRHVPFPYKYNLPAMLAIFLSLAGCLGTTILGWTAISHIRRSAGRIYGLGLAAFDALLFPLLALDGFLFFLLMIVTTVVTGTNSPSNRARSTCLLAGLVLSTVMDFFIVWKVWRSLNHRGVKTAQPPKPDAGRGRRPSALVVALLILVGVFAVASVVPVWMYLSVQRSQNETPVKTSASQPSGTSRLLNSPPFVGSYGEGTIELIALAPQPSTNAQTWLPNGVPTNDPFPEDAGTGWAAGKVIREIAFRIRSRAGTSGSPSFRFRPESSISELGSTLNSEQPSTDGRLGIKTFGVPADAKEMNISIGIPDGDWLEVITLKVAGSQLHGGTQHSGSDGRWDASYQGIADKSGGITMSFNFTQSEEWETRMVSVTEAGTVQPLPSARMEVSGGLWHGMTSFAKEEFAGIKEFRLQRRKYAWVEFRNVSLQPGHRTTVEVVEPANPRQVVDGGSSEHALPEFQNNPLKSTNEPLLRPVPTEAARALADMRTFTDSYWRTNKMSDTNVLGSAMGRFQKEMLRRKKKIKSMLEGTIADPLQQEKDQQIRELRNAQLLKDKARIKKTVEQIQSLDIQIEKLINDATNQAVSANAPVDFRTDSSPAPPSASAAAFGPIKEQSLPFGVPCRMNYLQFHTGNIITIGDGPGDTSDHSEDYDQAESSGGLDVSAIQLMDAGKQGIQLAGHGCIFNERRKPEDWDRLTASATADALRRETWLKGVIEVFQNDFPATYLFKTAHGECGVLQITGLATSSTIGNGVKLRYKMANPASKSGVTNTSLKMPDGGSPVPLQSVDGAPMGDVRFPIPALNTRQRMDIAQAASKTLNRHARADVKARSDNIPAALWDKKLAELKPLRIVNDRVNVRIVLFEEGGIEAGFYVNLPISSYLPNPEDFLEFLPLTEPGDRTFGQIYRYKAATLKPRKELQ